MGLRLGDLASATQIHPSYLPHLVGIPAMVPRSALKLIFSRLSNDQNQPTDVDRVLFPIHRRSMLSRHIGALDPLRS